VFQRLDQVCWLVTPWRSSSSPTFLSRTGMVTLMKRAGLLIAIQVPFTVSRMVSCWRQTERGRYQTSGSFFLADCLIANTRESLIGRLARSPCSGVHMEPWAGRGRRLHHINSLSWRPGMKPRLSHEGWKGFGAASSVCRQCSGAKFYWTDVASTTRLAMLQSGIRTRLACGSAAGVVEA